MCKQEDAVPNLLLPPQLYFAEREIWEGLELLAACMSTYAFCYHRRLRIFCQSKWWALVVCMRRAILALFIALPLGQGEFLSEES